MSVEQLIIELEKFDPLLEVHIDVGDWCVDVAAVSKLSGRRNPCIMMQVPRAAMSAQEDVGRVGGG